MNKPTKIQLTIMRISAIVLSLLVLFASAHYISVRSQATQKTVSENGISYLLHKVEKGETLYGLSKKYQVSQKDISLANNNLLQGLQLGATIRIPQNASNGEKQITQYSFYKVEEHDNLTKIAAKNKVTVNDLIEANNLKSSSSVKAGQVLKIPKEKYAVVQETFVRETENYIYHTVAKGQTLYSIKEQYKIKIEDIKAANPSLGGMPQVGQVLRIPVKYAYDFDTVKVRRDTVFISPLLSIRDSFLYGGYGDTPCTSFTIKNFDRPFKIAILLPFRVDKNEEYDNDSRPELKNKFFGNTEKILEMYEGILLAADSMRKTGMNISLYVYDTKADTYELRKILDKPNMLEMDLVIGPVYNELVDIAARWAQRNRINMVMPVSQSDQYLMNNRYVFQANPSVEARVEKAAMYLARYWDKNIVILHNNTDVEKNLIEIYKNKLAGSFDYSTGIEQVVIKEINCKLRGLDKIESALSQGENIVIVPSSDEAFASEIVNKLYSYADKYKIHVFGMSNWVNFQNMELQYLQKLNGTFFTTGYINYSNKHVANFVASYRTKFKAEPDEFAYQGFDIMYYFCSALKRYGPNFKDCLSPTDIYPSKYGLRTTFEFDNIDRYSGFRNKGVFIVRINENFETVPVEVDQNVNYFFKFEWN